MADSLDRFTRQLAAWSDAIITHGRTPFRKVDLYPDIVTEQGIRNPALVFWINRQSLIAGGLLLIPDGQLEQSLEQGRLCAAALGLQHFVTWEERQVRIWHCRDADISPQESFPLGNADQPESFRLLLRDLLDSLKIQAVTGTVDFDRRPACHLINLFQMTLHDVLPSLTSAYRAQRADQTDPPAADSDHPALERGRLFLVQTLAALWFNLLPEQVPPEDLPATLDRALAQMPHNLDRLLSPLEQAPSPPLPREILVRFHHLILRLRQLSWKNPPQRARNSIHGLSDVWYPSRSDPATGPVAARLHPSGPITDEHTRMLLSDRPALLALTSLRREFLGRKQIQLHCSSILRLRQEDLPSGPLAARFCTALEISSGERGSLTTLLRLSWPHRRFQVRTGQPRWLWELIHLLGLSRPEQQLHLSIPRDILQIPAAEPFWSMLRDTFCIHQLTRSDPPSALHLLLSRGFSDQQVIPVIGQDAEIAVPVVKDPVVLKNRLLLALCVPREIFPLLSDKFFWPNPEELSPQTLRGFDLYRESRLFQLFCTQLQTTRSTSAVQSDTALQGGVPVPEPLCLAELADRAHRAEHSGTGFALDETLAELLSCPVLADPPWPLPDAADSARPAVPGNGPGLKERILQELHAQGIPAFPEQYLYFLDQPRLRHFQLMPPLEPVTSFMGQFELKDARGKVIKGYGAELEEALLFAAEVGKTALDLPEDRHQLAALLDRYKTDLEALYRHLKDLCYAQLKDVRTARKMVSTIWQELQLPGPDRFRN